MKTFVKTSQANLFDLPQGMAAATRGIELAAEQKASLVIRAREIAISIARNRGSVNADDLQAALAAEGVSLRALGNACGSIFRDRRFVFTGQFVKSKRISSHANLLRVWSLK